MTRRIRVLRVIARMNVGGPALQVVNLTRGLDPDRFETRLLIGDVAPDEADYLALRAPDVAAVRIPGLGRAPKPMDDGRALRSVIAEMRRFRPDIVHTHTAKAGVIGRTAARLTRVPITVHTFHGHLLHGYFRPSVTSAVVATERLLAHGTTRLAAVGATVRDELLAAGIGRPEQYVVVPPGVALPAAPSREQARRALGLPPTGPVVAYVARLTTVKQPLRVVEVLGRLRGQGLDVTLVVAGEGEHLEAMKSAAAPFRDAVRFLGWRPDVETIYAAADLTLLTSDNEGMPVSLIEAAMCGCPAVATDVGSTREVVLDGVTGLVTPVDVEALTGAAASLLSDATRLAAMSTAARSHAATAFGADRLVADTQRIYDEVAAKP